jgi:hypothetical protein
VSRVKGWRIGFFVVVGVGSVVAVFAGMALAAAGDDPRGPAVLMSPVALQAHSPWEVPAQPGTASVSDPASAPLIGDPAPPADPLQVVAAPSRPSFERWRRLQPDRVYRGPVTVYLLDE